MRSSPSPESVSPFSRDWRDGACYQSLREYDCVKWAAEWLCRNPEFIADLRRAPCRSCADASWADGRVRLITCPQTCSMARWGLRCCRLDTDNPVFLWLPEFNSQVLRVSAERSTDGKESVDLRQCSLLKAALQGTEEELNLLFSDGSRTLQVVLQGASSLDHRISPRCALHGVHDFETKPLTLQRLCCLYKRDRLVKSLYPGESRSRRWIEMLRAWDGVHAGARHRDIAAVIFGDRAAQSAWDQGYRQRVQRLVRSARRMVAGGYLSLFR